MAGIRGPDVEMLTAPSRNAAVIVHRQRASLGRSGVTTAFVTGALPLKTLQWKVSRARASAASEYVGRRKFAPHAPGIPQHLCSPAALPRQPAWRRGLTVTM